ncbi:MAG: hypothetical protein LBD88_05315 [Candidatus Peribacteria bacterium]|nr:hypothetical protein [Candidatus Peribacteria bacterium]
MIFEQVSYSKSGSYTLVDNDLNTLANMPETIEQTTFLKTEYSQIV